MSMKRHVRTIDLRKQNFNTALETINSASEAKAVGALLLLLLLLSPYHVTVSISRLSVDG